MSLQVWLPLNGNFNNQGLSDLLFTSSGLTMTSGNLGYCYSKGSDAGWVISNKKILLGKNQSMFCWVKPNIFNTSANLTGVCGQHRYHSCTNMGITLTRVTDTTGKASVNTGTGDGRTYTTYTGNTILNAGTWYHIGYTYDGTTIKIYVNGKLDGSHTVTNLSFTPDYVQCFNWSLSTSGKGIYSGYTLNGCLNDVRMYNHTLSNKEVKELAKGLMLHYTFGRGDYDTITNLFTPPAVGNSATESQGWDKTLHPYAISVAGWSVGYNSGVKTNGTANAQYGYHAHWQNIDGIATMVFPKLNYSVSGVDPNRWLGISSSGSLSSKLSQGVTYTVSFEAMADTEGMTIYGGYYYNSGFGDGSFYAKNIPVGKWKRYSFTLSVKNAVSSGGSFYFYGHDSSSANGTSYLRNPQVEVGNVCHDYVKRTKGTALKVYDSSGFNHHADIVGTLSSHQSNVNTIINGSTTRNYENKNYSAYFNGTSYARYVSALPIPQNGYTITFWLNKQTDGHIIDWRAPSGEAGVQPAYIGGNKIQYYSSAGGSAYFDYVFNHNTWYHIAIVVTTTTASLYVNGILQQSISASIPPDPSATFSVGCRVSNANIMKMNMKDLRVYATTLTAKDIQQKYQIPVTLEKNHTIYAKELKEGSGV